MNIKLFDNADLLGLEAAKHTAKLLNEAIAERGEARLLLSTGASQLSTINALIEADVDWTRVTMFHLDEYVDLPLTHKASFQKYLQERFVDKIGEIGHAYYVLGNGDTDAEIARLTEAIRQAPIDVALIGIGANAHIAFNDPPADFETKAAFHVVNLDDRCKLQQVDEGWFPDIDHVPNQAISMTVHQILESQEIISCVPYQVKAEAIRDMLAADEPTPMIPASILKTHPNFHLYLDQESASLADPKYLDI